MAAVQVNGLELHGAYSRKTVMADWRAGKDFKIVGGPYCSNRDIALMIADGFGMLEFMQDGMLVERLIIDEQLSELTESLKGTFYRV